jgi:hypothetical protein
MLQKDKHAYIKNILKNSSIGYKLSDQETRTLAEWYMSAPSHIIKKKRPVAMSIQKATEKYGTKCLRFEFEDGSASLVSRLVIVGKKEKTTI